MNFRMTFGKMIRPALLGAAMVVIASPALPARAQGNAANDQQTVAAAQHALNGKRFSNVHVSVENGVATLTGTVDRLVDKTDAEKKVRKDHAISSVNNEIEVAGGRAVPDEVLAQKLEHALAYDRVGYGTTTFNWPTVRVENGVVTLGGLVVTPMDKNSAVDLVKTTPGVRGLIDHMQVAPPSPLDERIRHAEARAIYGAPQLNRYALNPAKPIRIVVLNGHVTLEGVVNDQADKDVAGIQANTVPGVFSVTNDLQVSNGR